MANAYSQRPLDYQQNLQLTDVAQYTGAIQGAMQQKFDLNMAKIDDLVSKVTSVPLVRDKDKQYLGDRLQTLLSTVDATTKLDMTDSTATRQISNYISTAVDENVKTQLANSQKIYSFEDTVKTLQKKDPKTYNSNNYAYAKHKAGFSDYISGKSDELGSLEYTPYTDPNKVLDELKKIKELKGDEKIQIPDPQNQGLIVEKTLKGLKPEEIMQYMPNLLSSQVLNQLRIDGWAKYSQNPEEAKNIFKQKADYKLGLLKTEVEGYKAAMSNTLLSEAVRAEHKQDYERKNKYYVNYKDSIDKTDLNDVESIGYLLEKDNFETSIAKIASGRVSTEYKKDDYYFANENLKIAQDRLELERQKAEKEAAGTLETPWAGSPRVSQPDSGTNFVANMNKEYMDVHNNVEANVFSVYNRSDAPEEAKRQMRIALAKKGFTIDEGKLKYISGEESKAKNFSRISVLTEAFSQSGLDRLDPQAATEVHMNEVKARAMAAPLAEANKASYIKVFNEDPDKYIEEFRTAAMRLKSPHVVDEVAAPFSGGVGLAANVGAGALAGFTTGAGIGSLVPGVGTAAVGAAGAVIGGVAGLTKSMLESGPKYKAKMQEVGNEIDNFVKDNGGWFKLKESLRDNPAQLKRYADLMEKAKDVSAVVSGPLVGQSFKEKSSIAANDYLVKLNEEGRGASFGTLNEYNMTDKKEKEQLINLISQSGDEISAEFSAEGPITVTTEANGAIKIKQNKGVGTKEGSPFSKAPAVHIAAKGTAIANFVENKIDIGNRNRGLDATVAAGQIVTPSGPVSFLPKNDTHQLQVADEIFQGLHPNTRNAFLEHPENYLSKTRTRDIFEKRLSNIFEKEQIAQIVDQIEANLPNYEVVVKPINGLWGGTIINKRTEQVVANGPFNKTASNKYLDPQLLNIAKTYPQILIMDSILKAIVKDPTEIKDLF